MTYWTHRAGRALAAAALASILLTTLAGAQNAEPFQRVDGDVWIAGNAQHDGDTWQLRNAARPAFALQLPEHNDIPFDAGTAGASFWVRNDDNRCGAELTAFGTLCGWQLALAITQYRSIVVGGNGIEIDGLTRDRPYGRFVNSGYANAHLIGMSANVYADWSGADVRDRPRWFAGFDVTHDRFTIGRGVTQSLASLATLDANGTFTAATARTARLEQSASGRFATRIALHDGSAVFLYPRAYDAIPVCIASTEGRAWVRVQPTRRACTIVSNDPHDRAVVDVQITADPS